MLQKKTAPNPPTKESTSRDAIGLEGEGRTDNRKMRALHGNLLGTPMPLPPRKMTPLTALA